MVVIEVTRPAETVRPHNPTPSPQFRNYDQENERQETVREHKNTIKEMKEAVRQASSGGGWRFPFFVLFVMIVGLAGVGYNRYTKLYGKSHLP